MYRQRHLFERLLIWLAATALAVQPSVVVPRCCSHAHCMPHVTGNGWEADIPMLMTAGTDGHHRLGCSCCCPPEDDTSVPADNTKDQKRATRNVARHGTFATTILEQEKRVAQIAHSDLSSSACMGLQYCISLSKLQL